MKVDSISWKILDAVQSDGRISLKALAAHVGLSLPAVSERLKRLEEAGIIDGYQAVVKPEAVGYGVMAIIGITTLKHDKSRLIQRLEEKPEVLECLHMTGNDSYLVRVVSRDMRHLEQFIGSINQFGETRTSIVLSAPIEMRQVRTDQQLGPTDA